jgi:hypothetical protein
MTPPGMRGVLSEAVLIYFATVILVIGLQDLRVPSCGGDTSPKAPGRSDDAAVERAA